MEEAWRGDALQASQTETSSHKIEEGGWSSEHFGDYDPETKRVRVWIRIAVRKHITSSGTFLSTLCHEFCHHLDYEKFSFGT